MNGNISGNPGWLLGGITPATAGHLTGLLIIWLALLAGIGKCWQISRRPATNPKCALALMLLLIAVLVPSCFAATAPFLGNSLLRGLATALMGLAMMGALVVSLVLAILGLVEVSRQPDRYRQGRAQGMGTLVGLGLLMALFLAGLVAGLSRGARAAFKPGQTARFEEENFEYRTPDRPWVALNATNLNQEAKLAFMRPYPQAWFLVMADKIGTGMDITTAHYAEVGKEHMRAMSGDTPQLLSEIPLEINGVQGLQDQVEVRVARHSFYYQQWYAVTNGYAYQLMAYGSSDQRERVTAEAERLFQAFQQIDPHRVAATSRHGFAENHVSQHADYLVNVTNSAWFPSATLEKNLSYADFTASQGDSSLVVTPIWLGERKVSLEALTAGFLNTLNVEYPNEQLTHRQRVQDSGYEGVSFDFHREVNGIPFTYRFKIVRGNGNAIMVAAWTKKQAPYAERLLTDAFSRVKFEPHTSPTFDPTLEYSAREHQTLGYVLNQAGLYHLKAGEYEPALPLFCAALRANPQEPVYLQNALLDWRYLDRPRDALAFLEQQPAARLTVPAVRADQAYFQAQLSLNEEAATNYAAVFAAGFRNDLHFGAYVSLLCQQRQYDQALAVVQSYLQGGDSVATRLLEAAIYRGKKDFATAIRLLQTQQETAPENSQIARALAETFIQAGQYNEALTISRGLLERNGDSANDCFLKGRSELGLKWYREARKSLEAAAQLAPANRDIRSYLDLINGRLGEGDNSLVREVIEPVGLPASLTNLPAGPPPEGYATNYGAYYLRRLTAISYIPGKECKTTEYTRIRVLDAYGVSAFSTVQMEFDPLNEQLYANEIRVLDPDGQTISAGSVDNSYVLDDRTSGTTSQKKILNLPVSGLQPGCQLAVTVTRRTLGTLTEFPFLEHCLAATFPARESILFVTGDTASLKFRAAPPREPAKLPAGLVWRAAEPLTARWEPLQPVASSFLPIVWIGDADAHWTELTSNYLASISDRLQPDASLRELARRLTNGVPDDAGKLAALARYVQTNYTYKALEFGRRARIPNPPAEIIRNKYGDCKDHAVLLQQLLTAAGVPAQLALVNTRDLIQKDLPSLDQFNHMIVYADGRFLDCTSKGADVARTIPYGQAGREALILDPQNPHFATIPAYAPTASTVDVRQHLRLTNQTDLAVEENLTLDGVAAAGMREYLLMIPQTSLKTTLQNQLGMAEALLEDVQVESLDTPSVPLVLKFKYLLKKQFHPLDDRLTGTLRAGFARSYLAVAATDDRRTPFETKIPITFRSRVTLETPAGFQVEPPDVADNQLDPRFATATARTQLQGPGLQLDFECQAATGRFGASDYAAYQNTMNQALSVLEKTVVFKPRG